MKDMRINRAWHLDEVSCLCYNLYRFTKLMFAMVFVVSYFVVDDPSRGIVTKLGRDTIEPE